MAANSAMAAVLGNRDVFDVWVLDRLRSTDNDYQGHVSNTVHPVLFANGRYDFLKRHIRPLVGKRDMFALAKITLEYVNEMHYPGEVEVGTLVGQIGRSSCVLGQGMFNEGKCIAVAESVMVQLDPVTRRAKPWSAEVLRELARFTGAGSPA